MISSTLASQVATPEKRVAVVLNRHARGVSDRRIRRLARMHPHSDIFLSEREEHSALIARTVLERGYDVVLLGGGDGTFVRCLTDLEAEARRTRRPLPGVGVLRLGTGNALGYHLGASPPSEEGLMQDLRRAQKGPLRPLPLLRVDGTLTPFAGTGLDSQILEDYRRTSRFLDRMGLSLLSSPLRYALAVAFCSVPRFALRRLPAVEVRNVGGPAFQIGPDGKPDTTPLPAGTVLYRGPCTFTSAATIPCVGFNVRLWPFADLFPGKFHLRCTDASALETLAHLPGVIRGDYFSPSIRDFLCDAVEMKVEHPVPFQSGGDVLPERREFLRIELAGQPIQVISA